MINIHNVSKSYGTFLAIHDITLSIPSCSTTALVGLNGAGKTTLLKAISSIHYTDTGSIIVNTIDSVEMPEKNKAQIGFVGEHFFSSTELTVYEYLFTNAKILCTYLRDFVVTDRIKTVTNLCSLQSVLNKKIKELSKGFRQRVCFALALLHDPPVLLLDEPTSGLDPKQIVEMRTLIKSLSKTKTIVISTHLMQEIDALCDKIAILHKGSLVAYGTEEQVCNKIGCVSLEQAFIHLEKAPEKGCTNV